MSAGAQSLTSPDLVVRSRTDQGRGLSVDGQRLVRRLAELAEIGADPTGGVTRLGFSEQDVAARRYLEAEAAMAGLVSWTDPAGNLLFRRAGTATDGPRVLMGSHLDTVVNGGPLDGAYGVVAALEVLQVWATAGVDLGIEPVAVAFANEEGALFPQPFWGSQALAGRLAAFASDPVDVTGASLREPLRQVGGDLDRLADAAWRAGDCAAYLEAHIEQGPFLEAAGVRIGVVESIAGRRVFEVEFRGRSGHAGTLPMDGRRDALVAASHTVLLAERLATSGLCTVATTGRLRVHPDQANVVPGYACLSVDFRDDSAERLADIEDRFRAGVRDIADDHGCSTTVTRTTRVEPVATDDALRAAIAAAADDLGLSTMRLRSGAGHDAQVVAAIAPVGMIFVPSSGGRSHVPEEHTDPADLVAGADVLLRAALSVAATAPGRVERHALAAFNGLPLDRARGALLDCCASPAWASAVAASRPYQDLSAVLDRADVALAALSRDEVEAAVAEHPRIGAPPAGDAVAARWSREEQSAFAGRRTGPAEPLADGMRAYEEAFGRVFLVDAHGLDADAIEARLRSRLGNSPGAEYAQVRTELGGIVRRRLTRLLT